MQTAAMLQVHIRWMIRLDMPEVCPIEAASFPEPWSPDDFIERLRKRNCIGMVAEHADRVVGYMIYELHKDRVHVLNFAVHPAYRRHGVGTQMAAKLAGKLSTHRRTEITVAVSDGNLPAHLFWRSVGFRAERVLRDYYQDSGEDAYLFVFAKGEE